MQVPATLKLYGAVAVAVLAALWYSQKQATQAAAAVGRAIDPTSDKNVFYGGANAVVQAVTGDKNDTLGTWFYGLTHADPLAAPVAQSKPYTRTPAELAYWNTDTTAGGISATWIGA